MGGDFRWVYEDGFNSFTSRSLVTLQPFGNFGFSTIVANAANASLGPAIRLAPRPNRTVQSSESADPYQNCGELNDGNQGTKFATPRPTFQDMANTLIGFMDTETQSQFFDKAGTRTADDMRRFRQHEYDFYVQDSWKIRPNLTLELRLTVPVQRGAV